MSIRFVLLLFALFLASPALAQIRISDFVKATTEAPQIKSLDSQVGYLEGKPYKLSPLQKLEFRTQNRELQSTQQEYAFRITPANPWETRSSNLYFRNYQSALTLQKGLVLKEALLERYRLVIEFIFQSDRWALVKENKQLLDQQLQVLDQRTSSTLFDPNEYMRLKIATVDQFVQQEEITLEMISQRNTIAKLYPQSYQKEIQWNSRDLISIERLEAIVDSVQQTSTGSARLAYQQKRIDLFKSEYKLEKTKVNIGFLQTDYDRRRVAQDRTPFNISMGLTIPITNPNKGSMAKSKLDWLEAEQKLEGLQQETITEKEQKLQQVKNYLTKWKELHEKIATLSISPLPANLATIQNGDPMVMIKFNESVNNLLALEAKMRRSLFLSYIDYLAAADQLQQTPVVDFLSSR